MPDNLQPWYSSCSQGNWEIAAAEAGNIYAADSTDTEALAAMFIAYALEHNLESYEGIALESLAQDSLTSLSRTACGMLLMSASGSLPEDAEYHLTESIRLDPSNVLAWYLLGRLKLESDSTHSALSNFSEALSLDPAFLPARLEEARLLRDIGEFNKALDGFIVSMDTHSPSGILSLAERILLLDRTGETAALDSLENVLLQADSSAWIFLAMEQLHVRPDIALAAAEKGLPVNDPGHVDLAEVFLELGEYRRAAGISEDILAEPHADSLKALLILGNACIETHEISRAKEIFLALLEINPVSVPALMCLGNIAEQEARTEDAVDYYLRVLQQDTYNADARSRLRIIAGDSYNPESTTGSLTGFSVSASADLSLERGNRAFLEWGGNAFISYRFNHGGTSIDATLGGRSVTWEEIYGLKRDTLNTNRGWASLGFDYWFSESYYVEATSLWDRQMYTERPWQISSYCAFGWQKYVLSWLWFSPKLGIGSVNTRWTSGAAETFTDDFSVFASAGLWYRKPHTFIRNAEISGDIYFPPDNPENFISRGSISLALKTWSPLYVSLGYSVDYTRSPEISSWQKFNTSFTTSVNFDLF